MTAQTNDKDHFTTRSIHVGSEPDPATGALVPTLSVATTFLQQGINKHKVPSYATHLTPFALHVSSDENRDMNILEGRIPLEQHSKLF